ncbi:two component transcriptional regulator, LytTR family [Anaerovirgula multivorans]|uniref:Stage 0 sporulation protein A homolog n=1 Tax=Anaerovirgula multivorans TaxID=312168 RepID=A0A239KKK4_9FIRM|nr:LytTR family DNA-binding domain-containing protein [Anaerovirgula multivorans]SNT17714.1 two component transcriptional regulator, LytTR family [Anaerovirgula multivorans]
MGRILIVEDDPIISRGLAKIADSIDHDLELITTGYGEEALRYAKQGDIDAFFLDIQLKDYSGLLLGKKIRKIDAYQLTPIVFITAIPTKELLAFKEVHCYDYIVKPFSEEEVKKVFKTIIYHGISEKANKGSVLKLKQKEYTYIIQQEEIIYIESMNRKLSIRTIDGEFTVSTYTLNQILDELTTGFVQCHRGYIINSSYIEKIDKADNLIYLKEKDIPIPLGRKYKEELMDKY